MDKYSRGHAIEDAKASRINKLYVTRILPLNLRRTSNCSIKLCSTYFGSMPNGISATPSLPKAPVSPKPPNTKSPATKVKDPLAAVITNMKSRSKGRPTKRKTLIADIRSQKLGLSEVQIGDLIDKLQAQGKIVVTDNAITYKL